MSVRFSDKLQIALMSSQYILSGLICLLTPVVLNSLLFSNLLNFSLTLFLLFSIATDAVTNVTFTVVMAAPIDENSTFVCVSGNETSAAVFTSATTVMCSVAATTTTATANGGNYPLHHKYASQKLC